jgi:hypothetical protein
VRDAPLEPYTLFVVIGAMVALVACQHPSATVARLEEQAGVVESQRAAAASPWSPARVGEAYRIGDSVRTGAASTARLRVGRGGVLRLDPDTVVRFQRTPGAGLDVAVPAGVVEIEAGDTELVLETAVGAARIEPGARARVSASAGRTRLEVLVGTVILERARGREVLAAGQRIEIDVGRAVIEDDEAPGAAPAGDAGEARAPEPGDAGTLAGQDEAVDAGAADGAAAAGPGPAAPTEVDVVVRAGESPVIHDPRPPTAVGLRFDCAGEGRVEIAGPRGFRDPATVAPGRGRAHVLLGAGQHRYRIVCGSATRPTGTLTIRRDGARRALSSAPPRNTLDADGRHYTVLYQNHLPELLLRWSEGRGGGHRLHVVSGGKARTLVTGEPRHTFASGQLREGTHRWWFDAGERRSPETSLTIDFDNAAAAAYLRKVEQVGGQIRVEGAAVRDATVTLGGARVELDQHRRFAAQGRLDPGERSLALRIAHKAGGVHYYVLRAD